MARGAQKKQKEGIRQVYIEWCKMTKAEKLAARREDGTFPVTKEDFWKHYHVNRATLFRWEREPEFKRELANHALGFVSANTLQQMIEVQVAKALDGNTNAFKTLVKLTGLDSIPTDISNVKEDVDEEDIFKGMSDEEIEAWLEENGDDDGD